MLTKGLSIHNNNYELLVDKLKSNGINVMVFDDDLQHDTPDSVFPNNWITFHSNGDVAIYPMFAINRRLERREDILSFVEDKGFKINNIVDYTSAEDEDLFLEGTGSLVLDRVNKKAYCSISERSSEDLLIEFCEDFQYTPVIFNSFHNSIPTLSSIIYLFFIVNIFFKSTIGYQLF